LSVIEYRPIGFIHTPFKEPWGAPIQPSRGCGIRGTVELIPGYADGLADLEPYVPEFDHREATRQGWLELVRQREVDADDRFHR
jgi:tRNA (Thr-GGU) A37 N-methylase